MANPEHLEILKQGVNTWNKWRADGPFDSRTADLLEASLTGAKLGRANLIRADLRNTDLCRADLIEASLGMANLSGANLSRASLSRAKLHRASLTRTILKGATLRSADLRDADLSDAVLTWANLTSANLMGADLGHAGLTGADLGGADLCRANLAGANLRQANLKDADLGYADLTGADLRRTNLTGATFRNATFAASSVSSVDLSLVRGLELSSHRRPSFVDTQTLEMTALGLNTDRSRQAAVEVFLRRAGVSERYLETFGYSIGEAIEFFSCFISYSHEDRPLARRLHDQLQARGVRCWLDEKGLKPGDRILDVVDGAIRLHDKLLLCCSKTSLESWWVKDEIRKAQDRERKEERLLIVPLNLDGYLLDGWQDGLASDLTSRLAADFTGWETDNTKFEEQFERVVAALRADEGAKEAPPEGRP